MHYLPTATLQIRCEGEEIESYISTPTYNALNNKYKQIKPKLESIGAPKTEN